MIRITWGITFEKGRTSVTITGTVLLAIVLVLGSSVAFCAPRSQSGGDDIDLQITEVAPGTVWRDHKPPVYRYMHRASKPSTAAKPGMAAPQMAIRPLSPSSIPALPQKSQDARTLTATPSPATPAQDSTTPTQAAVPAQDATPPSQAATSAQGTTVQPQSGSTESAGQ